MVFKLESEYTPKGDQPKAIHALVEGLNQNKRHQVLLGVTGSGKTFTIANVIQQVQRPALVLAHNKTLAAQLCAEFRDYFPHNRVEYFVSYYDYYQPEAYIPSRDIYIEKEAEINEEIERLRHSATRSLLMGNDVIVVASVSCIYGLGTPKDYMKGVLMLKKGEQLSRRSLLQSLEKVQYDRNDTELKRGRYRVKGDTVDIFPSWDDLLIRVVFFGDEIEQISEVEPISGKIMSEKTEIDIYPATHYVVQDHLKNAIKKIKHELANRLNVLKNDGKLVEAHRLEQRTQYDMEMMREMGYCKGIENYSRLLSDREPGSPPGVLIDFFPDDFITIIDESHVTIPQVRGMYEGDKSRKTALVNHGFRLPSALDNRPLTFSEFEDHIKSCIYVSATPGPYELGHTQILGGESPDIVEQIIRPTGLIDPEVVVRSSEGQIDDLLVEIHRHIDMGNRVLITALTKRLSEDICAFLEEKGVKIRYLHSDIVVLERLDILRDLRKGVFDVLVGVNLLREGLDLPEVSLVAIFDADKEGFLRNERSLIQTMGRAARNINGTVILYADKMTNSIKRAMQETNRRRKIQKAYNLKHHITPKSIVKKISGIRPENDTLKTLKVDIKSVSPRELPVLLAKLEKQMKDAADRLEFEVAAVIRDQIDTLKESRMGDPT